MVLLNVNFFFKGASNTPDLIPSFMDLIGTELTRKFVVEKICDFWTNVGSNFLILTLFLCEVIIFFWHALLCEIHVLC